VATTTKKELVDRIAERTGTRHTLVKTVVHSFLDEIIAELGKGGRLEFRDFGVFETRVRAASPSYAVEEVFWEFSRRNPHWRVCGGGIPV